MVFLKFPLWFFFSSSIDCLMKWKLLSRVQLFATPWTIQSTEFSRPEYWKWVSFPFSRDIPNPGIEPRSPTLWVDSLPAEPQGKPKNTGMGSLSLLQWIFLTQELNQGLLHCRQIIYQLSYQGSPQNMLIWWQISIWSTSFFIRKMQSKTTVRYHCLLSE